MKGVTNAEKKQRARKNDLLLNNNHHVLRMMKPDLKTFGGGAKSSQAEEAFARVSANLSEARKDSPFNLAAAKKYNPTAGQDFKIPQANKKAADISNHAWYKKRNAQKEFENKKKEIVRFARFLFESMDIDMSESLEGRELVE